MHQYKKHVEVKSSANVEILEVGIEKYALPLWDALGSQTKLKQFPIVSKTNWAVKLQGLFLLDGIFEK